MYVVTCSVLRFLEIAESQGVGLLFEHVTIAPGGEGGMEELSHPLHTEGAAEL